MREGKKELTLKDYNKLFKSLYPQLCVFAYKYLDNLETSKTSFRRFSSRSGKIKPFFKMKTIPRAIFIKP